MKKKILLLLFCCLSAYIFACIPIFYSYYPKDGEICYGTHRSDLLKRSAVPFSRTEKQRLEFLNQQLDKAKTDETTFN